MVSSPRSGVNVIAKHRWRRDSLTLEGQIHGVAGTRAIQILRRAQRACEALPTPKRFLLPPIPAGRTYRGARLSYKTHGTLNAARSQAWNIHKIQAIYRRSIAILEGKHDVRRLGRARWTAQGRRGGGLLLVRWPLDLRRRRHRAPALDAVDRLRTHSPLPRTRRRGSRSTDGGYSKKEAEPLVSQLR